LIPLPFLRHLYDQRPGGGSAAEASPDLLTPAGCGGPAGDTRCHGRLSAPGAAEAGRTPFATPAPALAAALAETPFPAPVYAAMRRVMLTKS
jgi:hypothetical protein